MSDYKYTLEVGSPSNEDLQKILRFLTNEGIVPNTVMLEAMDKEPHAGMCWAVFDSELCSPSGGVKCWDENEHEPLLHNLSKQIPNATFELRGVCLDDPNNEMFAKAFQNGMYKEVWQDKSDLSVLLSNTPWCNYGEQPERTIPLNMSKADVFALTTFYWDGRSETPCLSLHTSEKEAEDIAKKLKKDFEQERQDYEAFDYRIDKYTLDLTKLTPAKDNKQPMTPDEQLKQDTLRSYHETHSTENLIKMKLLRIMDDLCKHGVHCDTDRLYDAAHKIYECYLRDSKDGVLTYTLPEIIDAFASLVTDGCELAWRQTWDSATRFPKYPADKCFDALMSIPDEVFDFWMEHSINDFVCTLEHDKEKLQILLETLGGKQPLEQTLAAAQSKASEQPKSDISNRGREEPTI